MSSITDLCLTNSRLCRESYKTLAGRYSARSTAKPKARNGSTSARTGVGRDKSSAERHEVLATLVLWSDADKTSTTGKTSGT